MKPEIKEPHTNAGQCGAGLEPSLAETLRESRQFKRKVAQLKALTIRGRRLGWRTPDGRRKMTLTWLSAVCQSEVSKTAVKLAWVLYAKHHSETGGTWMTRAKLAKLIRVHPKTLEAAVRELERNGLVVRYKSPLPDAPTVYLMQTFMGLPEEDEGNDCASPGGNDCASPKGSPCASPCIEIDTDENTDANRLARSSTIEIDGLSEEEQDSEPQSKRSSGNYWDIHDFPW